MKPYRLITCLIVCLMTFSSLTLADDATLVHTKTIKDQQLTGTVTGVRGMVQIRLNENEPWEKAQNGMKLTQGAEFRTGPRSAVQFQIPPDQTITLDRLGTIKLLTAVAQNNKIKTDLGMTYGRTRYDIRKAGYEHESTIRSPSATLSVRGTRVGIQDGASGFFAWSTQSRAYLTDQTRHKTMTFGAHTQVSNKTKGAADNMKIRGTVDPGDHRNRDGGEWGLLQAQPNRNPNPGAGNPIFGRGGPPSKNGPFLPNALNHRFTGFVPGSLKFTLQWANDYMTTADLDLWVKSPAPGDHTIGTFNFSTNTPSGGVAGDDIKDDFPSIATEVIQWSGPDSTFPTGKFIVGVEGYSVQTTEGVKTLQNYSLTVEAKGPNNPNYQQLKLIQGKVAHGITKVHDIVVGVIPPQTYGP